MVAEMEPASLVAIRPVLRGRHDVILARIAAQDATLREDFAALEVLDYRRSYDDCIRLVSEALK
jgi:hypothetical protein